MSDINGKAPINSTNGSGPAHINEPIVKVQPPRREDLQPSYAKIIEADDADADTAGWYGAMVGFDDSSISHITMSNYELDQRPGRNHWHSRSYSMLLRLPQPIQTRQSR